MEKKIGMINVGAKEKTRRTAQAKVFIHLPVEILDRIKNNNMPKGNVLEAARLAGIMAAKNTDNLIPLCHSLEIECVAIDFIFEKDGLRIEATAQATAKTGVEMEALTACAIAALTVYDMSKMFTHTIEISDLCLLEKKGGKSDIYRKQ